MQKIVDMGFSPQDHYDTLDVGLTELLDVAGVEYTDEVMKLLFAYNRRLRIGLGLPVEVPD